ncbi:MAG: peroxiredoxin [Halorubrum sp. J07HR59]|nr:MAG: peroxiredoxin [Halorubrum sp. J07HR59]
MSESASDFSLPNAGPGPDPLSLDALPDDTAFVALYFQRDHYCGNCRSQVQSLADRADEFRQRDAEIVSILPEPLERAQEWQDDYDLPYPLLADPDASAGDAYDQPVRFGILGTISDLAGRMPVVAIIDRREATPTVAWSYSGSSPTDRPDIDEVLGHLDDLQQGVSLADS